MRIFLLVLVLLCWQLQALSQQQCNSPEYRMELFKRSPGINARVSAIEAFTKDYLARKNQVSDSLVTDNIPDVITIPVVVHVLYNSSSQNISDDQVRSQIDVLNKDYRRQNTDTSKTPDIFKPVAADCGFHFVLAVVDPAGNATTGIIHKFTNVQGFNIDDHIKSSAAGGDDAWDCNTYLNIWVGNMVSGILGYSSVPGGPKETDGVVVYYQAFGTSGTAVAPFNKGRTTTHEIGHWLNLIHTWGDADCGDDHVADTPPQRAANRGCPGAIVITCGSGPFGDMFMNYMDFTDDACMNMFTKGQRERMRALFSPGGVRNPLLSSVAINSIPQSGPAQSALSPDQGNSVFHIYPNPSSGIIYVENSSLSHTISTVEIFNEMGQKVMSFRVNPGIQQLNISFLRSGVYYIKSDDPKNAKTTKLIKM